MQLSLFEYYDCDESGHLTFDSTWKSWAASHLALLKRLS